jgi:hypothetical protein
MATVTNAQLDIGKKMHSLAFSIAQSQADSNSKREEADTLSAGVKSSRLDLCKQVAEDSANGKWSLGDIRVAFTWAKEQPWGNHGNDRVAKTLGVFLAELAIFAHPNVRDGARVLIEAVETAYKQENPQDDDKPCRKWQGAAYKAVIVLGRAVRDYDPRNPANGVEKITCVEDVVKYARANDPSKDDEKIATRLKAIAKTLMGVYGEFPVNDFLQMAETLEKLKPADLRAAHNAAHGKRVTAVAPPAAPTHPMGNTTTPAQSEGDVAEGAYDPLDNVNLKQAA